VETAAASTEHVDVLIVGAGISGICAAHHLGERCPSKSFLILEGRDAIGGTWDLFRYPGIRSDSDMYTLGYSFKPWTNPKSIADGPAILDYLRETLEEDGHRDRVRFGHRVEAADWSSADARWTVTVRRKDDDSVVTFTCSFLFLCAGYYRYDRGHSPEFEGAGDFSGRIVHPQFWPQDLDYSDKRIVVIGSGATAVTLVPELAKRAARVTMLQRSPTYVVSAPDSDPIAKFFRRWLPERLAYRLVRWKNIAFVLYVYNYCRRFPDKARAFLVGQVQKELGPDFDVETHFTPRYNPWDQRVCLVPNGDLFATLREGRAEVVTDHIDRFTKDGIRLASGRELAADIIVTATGLELQMIGGMEVRIDGSPKVFAESMTYRGMMISDVPNFAMSTGYTNASWTLKCDLTSAYVCRLLNHMDRKGYTSCCPRRNDPELREEPFLDLTSGYVQRAIENFPKQGDRRPWRLFQNYALDVASLGFGRLEDGAMEFSRQGRAG
jgi:monooxygenase